MDPKIKIQQLWRYLKVQDDETLIVKSYNHAKGSDEFIMAKMTANGLNINVENRMPELPADKPFRLIQQLDSSGKHMIPLVEQMKRDEQIDY